MVLHGEEALEATHALIELHMVKDGDIVAEPDDRADIQTLLN